MDVLLLYARYVLQLWQLYEFYVTYKLVSLNILCSGIAQLQLARAENPRIPEREKAGVRIQL
jgi:hypothetical protein